jgi:hypothetical protein
MTRSWRLMRWQVETHVLNSLRNRWLSCRSLGVDAVPARDLHKQQYSSRLNPPTFSAERQFVVTSRRGRLRMKIPDVPIVTTFEAPP